MDDEWFENFIQDYRQKLAGEKRELEEKPTADEQRFRRRSPHRHHQEPEMVVTYRQTHPAAAAAAAATAAVEEDADSFFFRHCSSAQRSKEEERAERRRKQEDYRRCLDEQLAELRQRRERERKDYRQAPDPDDDFGPLKFAGTNLKGSKTAPDLRHLPRTAARSSSPPITSHYRGPTTSRATQTSIPRPFSSVSNRLSDLTELRQRYS